MMTPESVRDIEFKKSTMGYKISEVDIFIEEVAAELERLNRLKNVADKKPADTVSVKGANAYFNESSLQSILVNAQKVVDQFTEESKQKAEQIVADAEAKAKELTEQAEAVLQNAEINAKVLGETAEKEAARIIGEAVAKADSIVSDAAKKSEEMIIAVHEKVAVQENIFAALRSETAKYKMEVIEKLSKEIDLLSGLPADAKDILENKPVEEVIEEVVEEIPVPVIEETEVEEENVEEDETPEIELVEEPVEEPTEVETQPEIEQPELDFISAINEAAEEMEAEEEASEAQLSFDNKEGFIITVDEDDNEDLEAPKGKISFGEVDDEEEAPRKKGLFRR